MKELEGRIQKGFVTFKLFHPKLFDAILTCRTSYVPFTTTTTWLSRRALKIAAINYSSTLIAPSEVFSSHFVKTTRSTLIIIMEGRRLWVKKGEKKSQGSKLKTTSTVKLLFPRSFSLRSISDCYFRKRTWSFSSFNPILLPACIMKMQVTFGLSLKSNMDISPAFT